MKPRLIFAKLELIVIYAAIVLCAGLPSFAQKVDGVWDATVTVNDVAVPFRIELSTNASKASSYFFNGDERVNPSSEGSIEAGHLSLKFASYATELDATLKNDTLSGTYDLGSGKSYPFEAHRHTPPARQVSKGQIPNIDGAWEIQVKSPKGESAWRFLVRQSDAKISAAILRVDGDTGTLSGDYQEGRFVLSHFTGERPFYVEVTPLADESLKVDILGSRDRQTLVALRPETARARGLAPPDDPSEHTRLKNPSEPLHFSFPNLDGKVISDRDSQFQGKVVLVNITGSWCPNCHDEAPFLEALYQRYHGQGLEIVAIDFEPSEQLRDLSRLKAFIRRYGINYTYLVAGEPRELNEKMPQAENLNAWPTTFFVGRNGFVHAIHTGFTSRASGNFDSTLKDVITSNVAQLLSQDAPTSVGSN